MSEREQLLEWSEGLKTFHLPRWEELPVFDLYMEQVIALLETYLRPLVGDDKEDAIVTSAMINNYVKLKLIPKATRKRYSRKHLAYLIAITILKQVLTIGEVKKGIEYQAEISGLKEAYNIFCDELELAIQLVIKHMVVKKGNVHLDDINDENLAMKMATMSFVGRLVAEKILHLHHVNQQEVE